MKRVKEIALRNVEGGGGHFRQGNRPKEPCRGRAQRSVWLVELVRGRFLVGGEVREIEGGHTHQ